MRPLLRAAVPAAALATGVTGMIAVRAAHAQPTRTHYAPLVRTTTPVRAVIRASTPAPAPPPTPVPAPTPAPEPPAPVVSVHTILVGGQGRQWDRYTPAGGTGPTTPILVVLHGQAVNAAAEAVRDGLSPVVADGGVELVYPQGIGNSWNAGGCCGPAQAQNVDDIDFLRELVAQEDPGHTRPIYLAGYSNGGRLAYTVACDDPTLVDGFVIVDAVPLCTLRQPVTILQVDGTADTSIPFRPGDPGGESPPATVLAEQLRVLDGCTATPSTVQTGNLVVATYGGCAGGTRVGFAAYQGGTHFWPAGDATTPSAGRTIWSFVGRGQPW